MDTMSILPPPLFGDDSPAGPTPTGHTPTDSPPVVPTPTDTAPTDTAPTGADAVLDDAASPADVDDDLTGDPASPAEPDHRAAAADATGRDAARQAAARHWFELSRWLLIPCVVPVVLLGYAHVVTWATWSPPARVLVANGLPADTDLSITLTLADLADPTLSIGSGQLVAMVIAGGLLAAVVLTLLLDGWAGHLGSLLMLWAAWSALRAGQAAMDAMTAGIGHYGGSSPGSMTAGSGQYADRGLFDPTSALSIVNLSVPVLWVACTSMAVLLAFRAWTLWKLREDTRPLYARLLARGWANVTAAYREVRGDR